MNLINNLSKELFTNQLIFQNEEQVNIILKKILKTKVKNIEKRNIYLTFLSLDKNYSERLTIVANQYNKSISKITSIINSINQTILNDNHIIYLICLTNQSFFKNIPLEEQDLLYKYHFYIKDNQTWPIKLDNNIFTAHKNLINLLKKLEAKPIYWLDYIYDNLNLYEKNIYEYLISSEYYESVSSSKKKLNFDIIIVKINKIIKTLEIYDKLKKIIQCETNIYKLYYYLPDEEINIFKYYYQRLKSTKLILLNSEGINNLNNLIEKIIKIKKENKPNFNIFKLLNKIEKIPMPYRKQILTSLTPKEEIVINKAKKLYLQKLNIIKNLSYEEAITYVLLIKRINKIIEKVENNQNKVIHPNQLMKYYQQLYKSSDIETALNLLPKKDYHLLSTYLYHKNTPNIENINQIIYQTIPKLIEENKKQKHSKEVLTQIQLDYYQQYFGKYNINTFKKVLESLDRKDQILILKYINNNIYSPNVIYFTKEEENYFNQILLPKFKKTLQEIENQYTTKINEFKNYSKTELIQAIKKLSLKEQNIIYLKFGYNLDNKIERELTPNETRIYQNIVRKKLNKILIQNRLLNSLNNVLQNLINQYHDIQYLKEKGISDINILIYALNKHLIKEELITLNILKETLKMNDESINYIINECNALLNQKKRIKK